MKKFLAKLLSATLMMVMVLGIAIPVQAFEVPTSYDFESELRFSVEVNLDDPSMDDALVQQILHALGGEGVVLTLDGTFYGNDIEFIMFYELGIRLPELEDLTVTLRYWIDADFSDLSDPTMRVIMEIELPLLLRMMLNATAPELSYQFIVMDMGVMMAEIFEALDVAFFEISDEEMDELLSIVHEELELMIGELTPILTELWDELRDYVTIDFNFNHGGLDNGYYADLNLSVEITEAGESVSFDLAFNGRIININNAVRPVMPVLVDGNYVDLTALLDEIFSDFLLF
ncbi:MAG: hypothetical protein FWE05_01665 [Defluviitaleaceae bacterium]|nr:hypothetical protein [Defluviitaleaceae bacterium]